MSEIEKNLKLSGQRYVLLKIYHQSLPAQASLRCCVCDVVVADVDGILHQVLAAGSSEDGRRGWVSKSSRQLP